MVQLKEMKKTNSRIETKSIDSDEDSASDGGEEDQDVEMEESAESEYDEVQSISDENNESAGDQSEESEVVDDQSVGSDAAEDGNQSDGSEATEVIDDQSVGSDAVEGGDQSEGSEAANDSDGSFVDGNAGWADAISKVLRTNKPRSKKTLVLSRAKKINDPKNKPEPKPDGPGFEVDGEIKEEIDEKPEIELPHISKAKEKERKRKRKVWESLSRVKNPDVLQKDRERALAKIATQGVVQLFNAVRQQQRTIESGMKAAGSSERRKEQVLRSVDKNSFLDILMGPSRSTKIGHGTPAKQIKQDKKPQIKGEDVEDNKAPLWSVLRDDFLVGGKLKDWDRAPMAAAAGEASLEADSDSD